MGRGARGEPLVETVDIGETALGGRSKQADALTVCPRREVTDGYELPGLKALCASMSASHLLSGPA